MNFFCLLPWSTADAEIKFSRSADRQDLSKVLSLKPEVGQIIALIASWVVQNIDLNWLLRLVSGVLASSFWIPGSLNSILSKPSWKYKVTCVVTANQTCAFDVTNCVLPRLVHSCVFVTWWLVFLLIWSSQLPGPSRISQLFVIWLQPFLFTSAGCPSWIMMTAIKCLSSDR